ncbi:hypothetical protein ABEW34_21650 [Paenibacillus algorifonticola]|uniref:hypothetical protein n=1 Tax=Paenibacillus algorifonticola TaxID=684063 RepID=UPI003D2C6EBD
MMSEKHNEDRAEEILEEFEKALPNIWERARKETEEALQKERELFGEERRV